MNAVMDQVRDHSQALHTMDGRLQALPQLVAAEIRLALVRDEDDEVKRWCALSLTRLGEGAPRTRDLLEDPDPRWRRLAAWVTEQMLKSNGADVLIAWLPHARQEQIRRLQSCAQGFEGLCFLVRPGHALKDASPAPLRIAAALGEDWQLRIRVAKRRGPIHDQDLLLPAYAGGVGRVLTPALMHPSQLEDRPISVEVPHVVGSTPISRRRIDAPH